MRSFESIYNEIQPLDEGVIGNVAKGLWDRTGGAVGRGVRQLGRNVQKVGNNIQGAAARFAGNSDDAQAAAEWGEEIQAGKDRIQAERDALQDKRNAAAGIYPGRQRSQRNFSASTSHPGRQTGRRMSPTGAAPETPAPTQTSRAARNVADGLPTSASDATVQRVKASFKINNGPQQNNIANEIAVRMDQIEALKKKLVKYQRDASRRRPVQEAIRQHHLVINRLIEKL